MEPAFAMAEINLFGEVGVLKTINGLIDTARDTRDSLVLHIAAFIRADERTHVRKGQSILKCMTNALPLVVQGVRRWAREAGGGRVPRCRRLDGAAGNGRRMAFAVPAKS